jgi:uncharacterized membrane protein YfcA
MNLLLAILSGAFIGSVLGLVGAGGAMVSVPILLYIFHFTPTQATTAALAVVFSAALSGAIPKMRTGDVLYREALSIWSIGLITNVGGAILSKNFPSAVITGGFAIILIIAGFATLRGTVKPEPEKRMPLGVLILIALVIGAMTGVFGVGGGFLAIPILVLFYNTPTKKAAGTSLLIISINSMTSFVGHRAVWHEVHWHVPIIIGATAVLVSSFASHYSNRLPNAVLRKAFAFLLFAIATFTLIKTIYS